MMVFVELILHASKFATLSAAVRWGAAGTIVKANGITQTTSRTTTSNVQVQRYAVVTGTMDLIKEEMEVNIVINL